MNYDSRSIKGFASISENDIQTLLDRWRNNISTAAPLNCDDCNDATARDCPQRSPECPHSMRIAQRKLRRAGFGIHHRAAVIEKIPEPHRAVLTHWLEHMSGQLFIQASRGWGKTSILCIIARECMKRRRTWKFYQSCILQDVVVSEGWEDVVHECERADYLLVDDIGEAAYEYPLTRLKRIVDYRWRNEKPIVATTYLSDPELRQIKSPVFHAIIDRLRDIHCTTEIIAGGKSRRR